MKDSDEPKPSSSERTNGETDPSEASSQLAIPAPPETKLPVQFNQQVNIYQIPQNAWDKLSPEQTMELTKVILSQSDSVDERHFKFAMDEAKRDHEGKRMCVRIGAIVAVAGLAGASLLALYGHELASVSISLPLVTILAVIVGNRFLG